MADGLQRPRALLEEAGVDTEPSEVELDLAYCREELERKDSEIRDLEERLSFLEADSSGVTLITGSILAEVLDVLREIAPDRAGGFEQRLTDLRSELLPGEG